jgi:hypothetical protein
MQIALDVATRPLPLVVDDWPAGADLDRLLRWVDAQAAALFDALDTHGALLFRRLPLRGVEDFNQLAARLCAAGHDYVGGNSPRTRVSGDVFTATEYSKRAKISLHNEGSYLRRMPARIAFYCHQPATTGGQTLIASCQGILDRLSPALCERFERRRVKYISRMHGGAGLGRAWTDVFQTRDRAAVERVLREDGYEFAWLDDGGLRTALVTDAIVRHPRTGMRVWINQAEQWHPSSLGEAAAALRDAVGEDGLPHNACFGDGTPLRLDDLAEIRRAMAEEELAIDWHAGDVLWCDNYLVAHGRAPFDGARQVFVAMG